MITDTHCHIYLEEFEHDLDSSVQRALDAGVNKIVLPNIDFESIDKMISVQQRFPEIFYNTLGLHPTSVNQNYEEQISKIFSKNINIIGIGETGIDLYWDKTWYREQREAFAIQLDYAIEKDLPIIIHSRNSLNEVIDIVKMYVPKGIGGVFHCFPGNLEEAKLIIDMGFYLGIGGVLTYKNNNMTEVVKNISLEHFLVETDSPYLTPVPHRGKRNEPSYIVNVINKIAEIKNIEFEKVLATTTINANNLFGI